MCEEDKNKQSLSNKAKQFFIDCPNEPKEPMKFLIKLKFISGSDYENTTNDTLNKIKLCEKEGFNEFIFNTSFIVSLKTCPYDTLSHFLNISLSIKNSLYRSI